MSRVVEVGVVQDQVPEVEELNWMLAKETRVCYLDLAIVVIHKFASLLFLLVLIC